MFQKKVLLQRTNDILDGHLFELTNEDTSQFSQEYMPNQRLGCGRSKKEKKSFVIMKI